YGDRRYVHFIFRRDGQTQSLFVDDRPRGALPPAPVITRLTASRARVYRVDEAPYRVTATATTSHQLFFVADLTAAVDDESEAVLASGAEFVAQRDLVKNR